MGGLERKFVDLRGRRKLCAKGGSWKGASGSEKSGEFQAVRRRNRDLRTNAVREREVETEGVPKKEED